MSRKPMEGKLAEIAHPKTHLTPSRPIVRSFVESDDAIVIWPS